MLVHNGRAIENVNCCNIRYEEREKRPCKHAVAEDTNEDCLSCKHFVWIEVWKSRRQVV